MSKSLLFRVLFSVGVVLGFGGCSDESVSVTSKDGSVTAAWTQMPGTATDIAATYAGIHVGTVLWKLGTDQAAGGNPGEKSIYKYNFATGQWVRVQGGAVRIDVATDGEPWVVNALNKIYRRSSDGSWTLMPGTATDIGCGANGSVWITGTDQAAKMRYDDTFPYKPGDKSVYHWNGSGWTKVRGGGVRIDISYQVTVEPHLVTVNNDLYRRSGDSWILQSIKAIDVGCGEGFNVAVVSATLCPGTCDYQVFSYWNTSPPQWVPLYGGGRQVTAASSGVIYVVNCQGAVYKY